MRKTVFWMSAMLVIGVDGCASSRWAMDDPQYAKKYGRPYEEGEKVPRMAKQLIDARHIAGGHGLYVSAMGADEPVNVGGEVGLFVVPPFSPPWLETRAALAGLAGGRVGEAGHAGGVDIGVRAQTPSRLAPFTGIGLFGGAGDRNILADEDDEFFGAVYPELGAHLWLTSRARLSLFGRYYVSTEGTDLNFWASGVALALLSH